jgi:hypothetical protein
VSGNPRKVNASDETMAVDLADAARTREAVKGSAVVYLTAGLPYGTRVWQELWPLVMRNAIDACARENAKLVFFDNVHMYGRVELARALLETVKRGDIRALIARSADFYGPNAVSFVTATVFENYLKGKKVLWMCSDRVRHSMTCTPDAGRATALLGNTDSAYGRVWHLPTDRNAPTGREYLHLCASAFGRLADYTALTRWMIRMAGVFNPVIRESVETLYQFEHEYLFDGTRCEKAFKFRPTPYSDGVEAAAPSMNRRAASSLM